MERNKVFSCFPKIGSDEVGKGDFFGPLIVCAVYVENPEQMEDLNARDSKSISDYRVKLMAPQLMRHFLYSLVKISPEKYNELYTRFKNINVILGWAHAQAVKNLLEKKVKPKVILVDKFGPEFRVLKHFDDKSIHEKTVFLTNAEMDLAVASASIIARNVFLNEIHKLKEEAGLDIPLGASRMVDAAARKLSQKIGRANLSRFVKTHFKNYSRL